MQICNPIADLHRFSCWRAIICSEQFVVEISWPGWVCRWLWRCSRRWPSRVWGCCKTRFRAVFENSVGTVHASSTELFDWITMLWLDRLACSVPTFCWQSHHPRVLQHPHFVLKTMQEPRWGSQLGHPQNPVFGIVLIRRWARLYRGRTLYQSRLCVFDKAKVHIFALIEPIYKI